MVIYPTYSEESVRDSISISLHSWGILGLFPHCRYFRPKTANKRGCWSTRSFQLSISHAFCGSFIVNIKKPGNVRINVTLRRVRATIFARTNCERVWSLSYPAYNGNAPYCHLRHSRLYSILHIIHRRYDFRKKKVTDNKIRSLIFSTTFDWNISHF